MIKKDVIVKKVFNVDPKDVDVHSGAVPNSDNSSDKKGVADSTSALDISIRSNPTAFQEIIDDADKIYKPKKLKEYFDGNEDIFLKECHDQIFQLWRRSHHLTFHYATFHIEILIHIGQILTLVEEHFKKRYENDKPHSKYVKWVTSNFGVSQLRLLQQSKNLYTMGKFAKMYKCIGKNRLLELYRIVKKEGKKHTLDSYNELIKYFPMREYDLTHEYEESIKNEIFKAIVDACITKSNLTKYGIEASYEQAELIALYKKGYLTDKEAAAIHEKLSTCKKNIRSKVFDDYVMNKMAFISDAEGLIQQNPLSISKRLIDFMKYIEKIEDKLVDKAFLEKQKDYLVGEKELLLKTRKVINKLVKQFGW